ncbi:MAG: hypothetical protein HQL82_17210 [Magnetococcales bacterium]|nr:hypothetical protein [Magnetococcales bacterium]
MADRIMLKKKRTNRSLFMALISYLGILCLVPLFVNDGDEFVNFHARQGMVLWIWSVLAILSLHLPVIGAFFFSSSVIFILMFSTLGMLSVVLTRAWKLPFVGQMAARL